MTIRTGDRVGIWGKRSDMDALVLKVERRRGTDEKRYILFHRSGLVFSTPTRNVYLRRSCGEC